ncbi:DUF4834 family protein [Robertkochia aurantiaca]|uniref:DUF4834 family protein n=1 Tax=Robertkochia aurantiaca TaxID=2873700 RepID=UPI001CC9B19B|nr:DUF4834 family protein [Robertkochia sp. 3YJGBD-33]
MQFLRTILIILLILFGLRILSRLFAPFLIKFASRKMEKEMEKRFGGNRARSGEETRKEGETVIDKGSVKRPDKNSSEKVGEYIDFEELD